MPPAPVSGTPAGFVTVFPGWNVWSVWRSDDPIQGIAGSIWNAGLDADRITRIWVEDEIKTNAPGAAVADPANPGALKGDQVQIIPSANGLAVDASRADTPQFAGALQLGEKDSKAQLVFVRFYNRGAAAVMPWPHDENFLLDSAFLPSSTNTISNGAAPSSLGGTATDLANQAATVIKVVAIGGGVVLATVLVLALVNSKKAAA